MQVTYSQRACSETTLEKIPQVYSVGFYCAGRGWRFTDVQKAKKTTKSFYGVEGDEGTFTYKKGWERIPENWYRIPMDYGLAQVNLDLKDWIMKYPELGR